MNMTKNVYEANAVTHAGTFHADEVLATVILDMVMSGMLMVARVNKVPKDLNPKTIVYDIGYGELDHHQKGGNGARPNGVPYASAGLVWKKYGMTILAPYASEGEDVSRAMEIWNMVDKKLIQPVDAGDNGAMPKVDYPCQPMNLNAIVATFNPCWDDDISEADTRFHYACNMVSQILLMTIASCASTVAAKSELMDALRAVGATTRNADDEMRHILILDRFIPWIEHIFTVSDPELKKIADDIWFVVYPGNRGGYQFRAVPDSFGSFGQRKPTPMAWHGAPAHVLQDLTGVRTATFCHPNGFIGGADTLDDCLKLAWLAVTQ